MKTPQFKILSQLYGIIIQPSIPLDILALSLYNEFSFTRSLTALYMKGGEELRTGVSKQFHPPSTQKEKVMRALPRFFLLVALALALGLASADAKPMYIDSPPLAQVVKGAVGDMRSGPVQVPDITWVVDLARMFANGNGQQSKPGRLFPRGGPESPFVPRGHLRKAGEKVPSGKAPLPVGESCPRGTK